jgi:hypothetical protein
MAIHTSGLRQRNSRKRMARTAKYMMTHHARYMMTRYIEVTFSLQVSNGHLPPQKAVKAALQHKFKGRIRDIHVRFVPFLLDRK